MEHEVLSDLVQKCICCKQFTILGHPVRVCSSAPVEFGTTSTSSSGRDASPCVTRIAFSSFRLATCLRPAVLTSNLSSKTPKVTLLHPISVNGVNGLFKIMHKAHCAQIKVGTYMYRQWRIYETPVCFPWILSQTPRSVWGLYSRAVDQLTC